MTFQNALGYLMNYLDLVEKDISDIPNDESLLTRRKFERYINGETKILNKKVVISICVSIKLPLVISLTLLELEGIVLTNTYEDTMLLIVLSVCINCSFDEINNMLEEIEIDSLTNKIKLISDVSRRLK
jgi:hypothetical protein